MSSGIDSFVESLKAAVDAMGEWMPLKRIDEARLLLVGDTHGYVEVTEWALRKARELGVGAVVFLGDLVDRGPCGVENLKVLAEAIVEAQPKVVIVRGDHESLLLNTYYGFREELHSKVGADAESVVDEFYSLMPLAAVAGPLFLVHGGIPCRRCLMEEEPAYTVSEIEEAVESELGEDWEARSMGYGKVSLQLMWNDPRGTIDWFLPSARGQGIFYYGREAWKAFLEANKFKLIIRAHEVSDGFHVWRPDGTQEQGIDASAVRLDELAESVVTVFSSLYHGMRAGALLVDLEAGVLEPFYYEEGSDSAMETVED